MAREHRQSDAMILRLEQELEERNCFIQGLIANAQDQNRDLTDSERELAGADPRPRRRDSTTRLKTAVRHPRNALRVPGRVPLRCIGNARGCATKSTAARSSTAPPAPIVVDYIAGSTGSRSAMERLETVHPCRRASEDLRQPWCGSRPGRRRCRQLHRCCPAGCIRSSGPRDLPSATWYRPKVTQRTLVGAQGSAGAAADEKAELSARR